MPTASTIIPILGAQYFANPKDIAASLTEAEKEEVGYINWSVHLEEVRSFRQYRRKALEIEGSPLKFR